MQLLAYMQRKELSDEAMAEKIGDCSSWQVKKWKYRERTPAPDQIIRIESATNGDVVLRDWATRPAGVDPAAAA